LDHYEACGTDMEKSDEQKRDEILRRALNTPPKPRIALPKVKKRKVQRRSG
jgi:hypothetical protein